MFDRSTARGAFFRRTAPPSHKNKASTMSVVGIDLGLQNSLIAAAGRGGVDVILNGNSNRVNPYVLSCYFRRSCQRDLSR